MSLAVAQRSHILSVVKASNAEFDLRQSGKAVIRHGLRKGGLEEVSRAIRRFMGSSTSHLEGDESVEARFERIYAEGAWVTEEGVPSSGDGSTLSAAANVRRFLPFLLEALAAKTVVDIGCGDLTWMADLLATASFAYVGCDAAESVLLANKQRTNPSHATFLCMDACVDPLPHADVYLCREVLFHLSFREAFRLLENVATSADDGFLLVTTDPSMMFNADVETGDFRHLNLRRRPFGFGPPVLAVADNAVRPERTLAVWPLNELRTALRR
jgi:SAM-dependent methyltransferase